MNQENYHSNFLNLNWNTLYQVDFVTRNEHTQKCSIVIQTTLLPILCVNFVEIFYVIVVSIIPEIVILHLRSMDCTFVLRRVSFVLL